MIFPRGTPLPNVIVPGWLSWSDQGCVHLLATHTPNPNLDICNGSYQMQKKKGVVWLWFGRRKRCEVDRTKVLVEDARVDDDVHRQPTLP